ncbi:SIR2 family NAD-dependent protein deacylase [Rathayibacter festucae]|uniref:Uncharacterized protein n=1 Tax=Rathayibacter festucae DSM 15932 TaxID=1328866 RepID=A0A3Q9UYZ8_9MICO|nr:SIR2 family protein [Rathayibacter festucae]AZZ53552.1 hypothetical protein C1I64_16930 [Rathayibacter festucae DSM 15932]
MNDAQRFNRWLTRSVGALAPIDHTLANAIAALRSPIFTTNYDTLLEQALGRSSASWTQPDQMRIIATGGEAIGHLHGIYSDGDNVIFSEQDYARVISNTSAQNLQNSAFTMKTFLFIGFGAGTDDPNFKLMVDNFDKSFGGTAGAHYRLCKSSDVHADSDLDAVVDLAYGDDFADLPNFLATLVPDQDVRAAVDLRTTSFADIQSRVRDNSTLWRDTDSLEDKSVAELIVEPIFLPEPHDQYAQSSVVEKEKANIEPIDIIDLLEDHRVILVAGEENSGVTTALLWAVNRILTQDVGLHSVIIDEPIIAGLSPISKKLDRFYKAANIEEWHDQTGQSVLAVDNLRFEKSDKYKRVVREVSSLLTKHTLIGVRQQDALDVASSLTEAGVSKVEIVYLGRFSNIEARELAKRLSPGSEGKLVQSVMIVIREKRLPRNPFTITLLLELIRNGSALKDEESEIAVLDKYVDLLLVGDFFRNLGRDELTLRNKRLVLVTLARKLVERKEDRAPQSDFISWIEQLFAELNWPYDALGCLNDLIKRRVLGKGTDNTVHFQRSAYLELMAGIAAQEDSSFRQLVFDSPLELASIVRTYAAMSRTSAEVLHLMDEQLDLIVDDSLSGSVFASVRQLPATDRLFSDAAESPTRGETEPMAAPATLQEKRYYDVTDDRDVPAFLTARIEDLTPGRVAALVIDLASRVLRDTDEIRDQRLKGDLLKKVLVGWVRFLDLYENDLRVHPEFDNAIRSLFFKEGKDFDEDDVARMKASVLKVAPSYLTFSGITYCLAGPSLTPLLEQVEIADEDPTEYSAIVRTLALYASGSLGWVKSLGSLSLRAKKSWFSASFLSSIARYAYVSDERLSDEDRGSIREFLRESIDIRYSFAGGVTAKNKAMNSFEDELRKVLLKEKVEAPRSITVLE